MTAKHAALFALVTTSLLASTPAQSAELVEVLPVSERILMVHFDDGRVTLANPGQSTGADVVTVAPLNRTAASSANSYSISSTDDSAYATAQKPTSVGRKSKGTEFANHCDAWVSNKCVNSTPDRALEHWVYLVLPTPLQRGKTYTVSTGSLATNATTTTLLFDETKLRSEAVHVNTVAYSTSAPAKHGYVYLWMGDLGGMDVAPFVGRGCHLVRQSDNVKVFSGTVQSRKSKTNVEIAYAADTPAQNLVGADVADCDFSGFNTPGDYVLSVDGVGSSFPFKLDADALRKPFYAAMKGLYLHRSGIAIDAAHGDGYSRPAPHNPLSTPGFAGKLKYTSTRYFDVTNGDADPADKSAWEAGIKGDLDTWGWYQDAGDWDAYFTHLSIPATLLTLYEQHPDHFSDGELNIPESGNGIADVVDEARWLIRFYHRTRHAILDKGYGTGGVGGARVMGDLWGSDLPGGLVAGSWQDTQRQWIVSGEDPWMTYRYAALAAHLALVLKTAGKPDPEGIDWQAEAIAAWTWAQANTKTNDGTAHGVILREVRMHAALALFRLTQTASYHDAFKTDFAAATGRTYNDNTRYWALLYPRLPSGVADATVLASVKTMLQNRANEELASAQTDRAMRWGGNFYMPMFLGEGTTPMISDSVLALELLDTLTPATRAAMKSRAYSTVDYFLGTNPLNMTWISRLGPRYPKGPFSLDGFAQPSTYPAMGLIPYGPVATARDFMPSPPPGPWASNWANTDVYPADIETWPGHERWFDQRTGISTCEFTIHQTIGPTAIVYGSLLEKAPEPTTTPDAGTSTDGGEEGGGTDGGSSPGEEPSPGNTPDDSAAGACGCQAASAPLLLMSLLAFVAMSRRSRERKR